MTFVPNPLIVEATVRDLGKGAGDLFASAAGHAVDAGCGGIGMAILVRRFVYPTIGGCKREFRAKIPGTIPVRGSIQGLSWPCNQEIIY
jgi:hypothetical protein